MISSSQQAPLVDTIFEHRVGRDRPRGRLGAMGPLLPWVIAIALHGGLYAAASQTDPSLETWSARLAVVIHDDLLATAPIAIEPMFEFPPNTQPVEPEPSPIPAPEEAAPQKIEPVSPQPRPTSKRRTRQRSDDNLAEVQKAPPAKAGNIISAASDPVDMTERAFITGTASAYVGGAVAAKGSNTVAVPFDAVDLNANPTAKPGSPSQARPVGLVKGDWNCPWPSEALAEDIFEQSVVLRATVSAAGKASHVSIVSDPGFGFGRAAILCAKQTRFQPARNRNGEEISAMSPPIRVRFTR